MLLGSFFAFRLRNKIIILLHFFKFQLFFLITFLQWLDRTQRGAGSGLRVCGGGGSPRSCSPSTSPQRSGPIFLISEVGIFTVRWNKRKETFTKSYEIKTTCKAYLYEILLFLSPKSQVNTLIIAEYYQDKALEHL